MFMKRAVKMEAEVFSHIKAHIKANTDNRPPGIHVSDLVFPLKAYYNFISPKEPTDSDIATYFTGNAFEHFFSAVIKKKTGIQHKNNGLWEGICYEMDFFDKSFVLNKPYDTPWEFKSTSQSWRYKDELRNIKPCLIDELSGAELADNFEHYVDQTMNYMVIADALEAYIAIFFWNMTIEYKKNIGFGTKKPQLRIYELSVDREELNRHRKKMLLTRDLILKALETKNPSSLEVCPKWLCKVCKHFPNECPGALALQNSKDPVTF